MWIGKLSFTRGADVETRCRRAQSGGLVFPPRCSKSEGGVKGRLYRFFIQEKKGIASVPGRTHCATRRGKKLDTRNRGRVGNRASPLGSVNGRPDPRVCQLFRTILPRGHEPIPIWVFGSTGL